MLPTHHYTQQVYSYPYYCSNLLYRTLSAFLRVPSLFFTANKHVNEPKESNPITWNEATYEFLYNDRIDFFSGPGKAYAVMKARNVNSTPFGWDGALTSRLHVDEMTFEPRILRMSCQAHKIPDAQMGRNHKQTVINWCRIVGAL